MGKIIQQDCETERSFKQLPAPSSEKWITKKMMLVAFVSFMGGCILSSIIALVVIRGFSNMTEHLTDMSTCEDVDHKPKDHNFSIDNKLPFIPRTEWLAQKTTTPPDTLTTPVPYVIISHTATETCLTQATCTLRVRMIQASHIESRGWYDIGYNFLVGGDGFAYEGRGWDAVGVHTYGYNTRSIGLSFIGIFNTELPSEQQLLTGKKLIEEGVNLGKIAKDYKLFAHRQLSNTEIPELRFFQEIKTWPHWAETP